MTIQRRSKTDDGAIHNLVTAIVINAANDWRKLCKGKYPRADCNFKELERFFEHDCEFYMDKDGVISRIYAKLQQERWAAVL